MSASRFISITTRRDHHRDEGSDELAGVERRDHRRLDDVAERLEEASRVLDRRDALRVDRRELARRGGAHPDAQASGVAADLLEERTRRRRRGVGVAGHRAGEHVEHRRAVAHGVRQRVADDEPTPRLADVGPDRDATHATA